MAQDRVRRLMGANRGVPATIPTGSRLVVGPRRAPPAGAPIARSSPTRAKYYKSPSSAHCPTLAPVRPDRAPPALRSGMLPRPPRSAVCQKTEKKPTTRFFKWPNKPPARFFCTSQWARPARRLSRPYGARANPATSCALRPGPTPPVSRATGSSLAVGTPNAQILLRPFATTDAPEHAHCRAHVNRASLHVAGTAHG